MISPSSRQYLNLPRKSSLTRSSISSANKPRPANNTRKKALGTAPSTGATMRINKKLAPQMAARLIRRRELMAFTGQARRRRAAHCWWRAGLRQWAINSEVMLAAECESRPVFLVMHPLAVAGRFCRLGFSPPLPDKGVGGLSPPCVLPSTLNGYRDFCLERLTGAGHQGGAADVVVAHKAHALGFRQVGVDIAQAPGHAE